MNSLCQVSNLGANSDFHSFRIHLLAVIIPWVKAVRMLQSRFFKVLECPNKAVSGSGVTIMLKEEENHWKIRDQKLCYFGQVQKRCIREPSAALHLLHSGDRIGKILFHQVLE